MLFIKGKILLLTALTTSAHLMQTRRIQVPFARCSEALETLRLVLTSKIQLEVMGKKAEI